MPWPKGNTLRKGCVPWNKGKKRSEETKRKISEAQKGKNNPNWKGGKTKHRGYILIWKSGPNRYVRKSRLVAEEELGRHLKPEETMHHRNGKRHDDKWENLFVFESNSDHIRYERFLRRK